MDEYSLRSLMGSISGMSHSDLLKLREKLECEMCGPASERPQTAVPLEQVRAALEAIDDACMRHIRAA